MATATASTKKQRPPATLNRADWRTSKAKQLVAQDVIDGLIPMEGEIDVEAIFNEHYVGHSFFKDFPFDKIRYKDRFTSIQKAVKKHKDWAQCDSEKFLQDRALHPPADKNIRGELRWKGSEAQQFLKVDMEQGLHLQMKPRELHKTRDAYKLFGERVFQQHIDQQKQSVKEFDEVTKQRRYKNKTLGDKSLSRKNGGTLNADAA